MRPYRRGIFDLFDGKRRYVVPLFQRQYVWTKEKQWEPLWEDIQNVAERRIEKRSLPPHFLGALVLDQIRTYGNQVPAHLIIDGQQRLITFQLILASLAEVANKVGANEYRDEIHRYLKNTGIMENPDEESFKVWPSRFDQGHFKVLIDNLLSNNPDKQVTLDKSLITEAHLFFKNAITDFIGLGDEKERIAILYQVLKHDLEVVSIELDEEDDPQIIFETLNARGEPLLPSDLLRNFLFWRANKSGEKKEVLYDRYWLKLEEKFWKSHERIGRLKRPRIDIFMQHFLQVQSGDEVNIGRLFHEYKTWINNNNPFNTIEDELVCLTKYAESFKQIIESSCTTSPYGKFFWRIRNIDVGTIYPLLIFILNYDKSENNDVNGMFVDLESYLFRRLICGLTPKNYNKLFLQVIRDLKEMGFSRENLRKSLLSFSGNASKWPNDEEFMEAWMNRRVYLEIKPAQRIVVILRAIEDSLRIEKNEEMLILSNLTIEHIMPKAWHQTWPLSDGSFARDRVSRIIDNEKNPEADKRDFLLDTFGNLTLLTHPLNASISNSIWKIKKPEIIKQSALALNRDLQMYDDWTVNEIEVRGKKLFERAIEIWPYPKNSLTIS